MSVEKSRWRGRWLPANAGATVVPLYSPPQPTLTDAERKAVEWAAKAAADPTPVAWYAPQIAATLRGLLERTK